ncbi:MAG: phage shock protein operon transcriptional activator [Pseudomonadota bacterium]
MTQDRQIIIGESPAFLDVLDHVSAAAPLDRPVLVIGERGTGKELIAGRLHYLSQRWDGPYVEMNCAALPETLLDAELFGYEPGAFTGAIKARAGRFEAADGGTLFLDEIAALSTPSQERLLRIVEYGEFQRLGSNDVRSVDVRLVAATNVDLPGEVAAGAFRADLLDRLSFEVITLPPLRARTGDVIALADHFGRSMSVELGRGGFPGFSRRVLAQLEGYRWPGNVRELKNTVERAVYRWPGDESEIDHINFDPFASPYRPGGKAPPHGSNLERPAPVSVPDYTAPFDLKARIAKEEVAMLTAALEAAKHNQKAAAKHCGLGYEQFRHLAKKYALI